MIIEQPPAIRGVLETALYVGSIERSRRFYQDLFGFPVLVVNPRIVALEVPGRQVLLLFTKGGSVEPIVTPGGIIPAHDGSGTTHLALAIDLAAVDAWRARLARHGIPIESEVEWPLGGRSLYFRDPDQHAVELVTPGLWWPI